MVTVSAARIMEAVGDDGKHGELGGPVQYITSDRRGLIARRLMSDRSATVAA